MPRLEHKLLEPASAVKTAVPSSWKKVTLFIGKRWKKSHQICQVEQGNMERIWGSSTTLPRMWNLAENKKVGQRPFPRLRGCGSLSYGGMGRQSVGHPMRKLIFNHQGAVDSYGQMGSPRSAPDGIQLGSQSGGSSIKVT